VAADVFAGCSAGCAAGSSVACTARVEQWGYLQLGQLVPIEAVEKSMPLHLYNTVSESPIDTIVSICSDARIQYTRDVCCASRHVLCIVAATDSSTRGCSTTTAGVQDAHTVSLQHQLAGLHCTS
jgi:hypothetical protein